MINAPFLILYAGALAALLTPASLRRHVLLAVPVAGLVNLLSISPDAVWQIGLFGLDLVPFTMDRLSFIFGVLFHVAAIIGIIFSWHVTDRPQQVAALLYPGSALGVVYAGDLLTMFVFWECLALASVPFITARGTSRAVRAAIRYLVFQVLSGVLLLTGALVLFYETGGIDVGPMDLDHPGAVFILAAFGIKAAFPMLHNWLTDAYPEATPSGAVFLSAFTTKVAVYALARTFAGLDLLIYVGAIMACFPIFYAVIENDLRRVLGYSMINQIGFMVCGVGIGTELAINGAVAHAFNDVIFKGLLMMTMGLSCSGQGKSAGPNSAGCFGPCQGLQGFAWSGLHRSRHSRCSAGSSASPWSCRHCWQSTMNWSGWPCCSRRQVCSTMRASRYRTLRFLPMIPGSVLRKPPGICWSPCPLPPGCVCSSAVTHGCFTAIFPLPWTTCRLTFPMSSSRSSYCSSLPWPSCGYSWQGFILRN